ncbi:hypothetical protein TeGR_g3435 [Tetraparma gracilis]|uniref:Pyrroline-5-carboxylate reductase catalytic N-terminal domain-containing protein n=1 Tax=Tetraparma gracilis TaxID=2962635 RepID=A0ABQ6MN29_9STRA|nr:hypothetical protein TeGR_g3435 [Tetraparma gracilis]
MDHSEPDHSEPDLTSPAFITRNLPSILALPPQMTLCSQSRGDASVVIRTQVLFLCGACLTALRNAPALAARPSPAADLVGLIGCGLIGSSVADALLAAGFPPASIMIASRDPQKTRLYKARGCNVTTDREVAATAKVVVVAVAPQHLRGLGNQLRAAVGATTSVGGVVGGVVGGAAAATAAGGEGAAAVTAAGGEGAAAGGAAAGESPPPNKCLVVSCVAGVTGAKLSKLLGLNRVVRTFVDVVQLPVKWGPAGGEGAPEPAPGDVTADQASVAAKNLIAEAGAPLAFLAAAVESLLVDLGLGKRDAKREATACVVGDGEIGGGGGGGRRGGEVDEDHPLWPLKGALDVWKEGVAKRFHKVFADEVMAKDLPSFLDRRQTMEGFGEGEEEEEEEEDDAEEE